MKRTVLAALAATMLAAAPVYAADTPATPADPHTAPAADPNTAPAKNDDNDTSAMPTPVEGVDTVAPLEGANSYTQAQVESMLSENGFTAVSGLMLDDKGVWRGTATHMEKTGDVAVDYRGNLFFDGQRIIKKDEEKPQ